MKRLVFLSIFILTVVSSCTSIKTHQRDIIPSSPNTSYSSSFPTKNVSAKLQQIQKSIQQVTAEAVYKMYHFKNRFVTRQMIRQAGGPDSLAARQSLYHNNKAGTAICILNNGSHAIFVTAAHILANPDTLISYRHGKNIPEGKYIATMGIKKGQRNYLMKGAKISLVHTLVKNAGKDLALFETSNDVIKSIPPISISIGNAKQLEVGSFIYILGYPLGISVVTRGIVSEPNYDTRGSFLTDAVSNHGISGGMIIATNDNFHSFEWVGMAVSALSTQRLYLVPEPSKKGIYWNHEAYTDTVYIAKKRRINYGLMDAIPINKIVSFLYFNANKINKYGLSIKNL